MAKIIIDVEIQTEKLKELQQLPGIFIHCLEPNDESRWELPSELIQDAEILFCTLPPSNLNLMKQLQYIQIASAGYTQLFGLALPEKGISAANATGVNDIPIAQWNIAMMINLLRDLPGMYRNQQKNCWERPARFQQDIYNKTVGIWGYGGIGRETARLAKSLGMRVKVLDVQPIGPRNDFYVVAGTGDPQGILPDQTYMPGELSAFLKELDFLILSIPLTKKTEGIIAESELQMLPRTAYLLNPARGPLVKENALLEALEKGWIAGAALDTHYYYPMPPEHPLWKFTNVIMTPHISGSTLSPNFLPRLWDLFIQNVRRFLAGQKLLNQLSANQLAGF